MEINDIDANALALMYKVALRIMKSEEDAQDVVQDALLIAHCKRHDFKGESKLSSWLYTIVHNCALMELRNRRSQCYKRKMLTDYMGGMGGAAYAGDSLDKLCYVQDKLTKLRDVSAVHLKMLVLEGLGHSNVEAGQIMGISVSAVKSRLVRARTSLKKVHCE